MTVTTTLSSKPESVSVIPDDVKSTSLSPAHHQLFPIVLAACVVLVGSVYGWQLRAQSQELAVLKVELVKNREVFLSLENRCKLLEEKVSTVSQETTKNLKRLPRSTSANEAFIGVHLVGKFFNEEPHYEQSPFMGDYFQWQQQGGVRRVRIRVENVDSEDSGTLIHIQHSGYYYVYAQVTYHTHGMFTTGHQLVRILKDDRKEVLMWYANTQKMGSVGGSGYLLRTTDSGYSGRICKLRKGDKIGVQPAFPEVRQQRFSMNGTNSFFGAYFLHL